MTTDIQVIDLSATEAERVGAHRGGGIPVRSLPFSDDGHGFGLWASIGTIEDGYYSPRHHHNFDQIRYMISGSTQFEGWQLEEGQVGYFPESVAYGPQSQSGDATIFTLQLSGASGRYYPTRDEVAETNKRLRETDPSFGKGGVGRGPDGQVRDSFEVLWEAIAGKPADYATPRYQNVAVMDPSAFDWREIEDGVALKHLGTFTEYGFTVASVRLETTAHIAREHSDHSEIWLQTSGRFQFDGREFTESAFFLPAGNERAGLTVDIADQAEFLVIRLPGPRAQR